MKTNKTIHTCGSITKLESLVPVIYHILQNTYVLELMDPYPGYYGIIPKQPKPNSLFLITNRFYRLEEVLRILKRMEDFDKKTIHVASAILDFKYQVYYAIRIKHFPDFESIYKLQSLFLKAGIGFSKERHISIPAEIKVFKCFELTEIEESLYIDNIESHHGYFKIPYEISFNEFSDIIHDLKNNIDSQTFDAAIGNLLIESNIIDIVRIYSEKLTRQLLKTIHEKFMQLLLKEVVPGSEFYLG
jgi:hypothetical protein